MTSLYDLLEVKADASGESIRTAFRRLALIHHPDKSYDPESEKIFKDINKAYQILSIDDLRTCYNVFHDPDASRLAELIDQAHAMFPGMDLISALQILHIIVGGPVVETTEVKGRVIKSYDVLVRIIRTLVAVAYFAYFFHRIS